MADDLGGLEEPAWLTLGVAGALARRFAADERHFLATLASTLEHALPGETKVEYQGGFFTEKTIKRVSVTLGETRYTLEAPGHGPLAAMTTRIVRGIALKTEPVSVQDWLSRLGAALDERARASAATRAALARLVDLPE